MSPLTERGDLTEEQAIRLAIAQEERDVARARGLFEKWWASAEVPNHHRKNLAMETAAWHGWWAAWLLCRERIPGWRVGK